MLDQADENGNKSERSTTLINIPDMRMILVWLGDYLDHRDQRINGILQIDLTTGSRAMTQPSPFKALIPRKPNSIYWLGSKIKGNMSCNQYIELRVDHECKDEGMDK